MRTIDRLLIATKNRGKVAEFRDLLAGSSVEVLDLSVFVDAPDVEETGETFFDNAVLKASAYARFSGCWAVADDSGLEVDALDRRPGVNSARWAKLHGRGEGDAANNALLLEQLRDVPDEKRSGRFVCVLALADPSGRIVMSARDSVEGSILRSPRGVNGFGYDPLFRVASLEKTTAELSPAEKHALSHRGKAMRRLLALLGEHGLI